MNKIQMLKNDLLKKSEIENSIAADVFKPVVLTEEEEKTLASIQKETAVMVEDSVGDSVVRTPIGEYVESLDDKIEMIDGKPVKMLNMGGIVEKATDIVNNAKLNAMSDLKTLAQNNTNITEESLSQLVDQAILSLKEYFHMDILHANIIEKRLTKMPLKNILDILPAEFVNVFVPKSDIVANNVRAKDMIITVISYLTILGPELDELNTYIEDNNKLILVGQRMIQCDLDFHETLKDPHTISEIIEEAKGIVPEESNIWLKYGLNMSHIQNEFAQASVVFSRLADAYRKLQEEYTDTASRAKIQEEIDANSCKMNVYRNVCNLDLMKELAVTLDERIRSNRKCNYKYLLDEAVNAVERIRRSKQDVPFPGYRAEDKKSELIFKHYQEDFNKVFHSYNTAIAALAEKEPNHVDDLESIQLDGYKEDMVFAYTSMLLIILMGRIMKKLSKNTITKYDAVMLDAYFKLFSGLGMDVYIMSNVWRMLKEPVQYVMMTYPQV